MSACADKSPRRLTRPSTAIGVAPQPTAGRLGAGSPRGYISDGSEQLIGIGQARAVSDNEDKAEVAGRLYVPDPEQRNGWREFYVHKVQEKPGARPLGFRKP